MSLSKKNIIYSISCESSINHAFLGGVLQFLKLFVFLGASPKNSQPEVRSTGVSRAAVPQRRKGVQFFQGVLRFEKDVQYNTNKDIRCTAYIYI